MDKGHCLIAGLLVAIVCFVVARVPAESTHPNESEGGFGELECEVSWTDVFDPVKVTWMTGIESGWTLKPESCLAGVSPASSVDLDGDGREEARCSGGWCGISDDGQLEQFMTFPSGDPNDYQLGDSPAGFPWESVNLGFFEDMNGDRLPDAILSAVARNKQGEHRFRVFWIPNTLPALPTPCDADTNNDGDVGFADVLNVLTMWGPCPE